MPVGGLVIKAISYGARNNFCGLKLKAAKEMSREKKHGIKKIKQTGGN